MREIIRFVLLSEAFAVTTFGLGWWTVPVVAAFWGMFGAPTPRRALFGALCAAFGWACLLLVDATRGSVATVASQTAEVMSIPPAGLYAVTLLFPALLAWSAATVSPLLRRSRSA